MTGIFSTPSTPAPDPLPEPADESAISAESRDRRRSQLRMRNSRQQTVLTGGTDSDDSGEIRRTVLGG